ncbi:hypothetical protein [Rubrivirga sp.]|uniref:hypothetical protein n=1 Tax=Rubrivirga sp. TaxID=1885344 RepID=UPI003C783A32
MYLVSLFAFISAALLGTTMAVLHFRGIKSGMALGIAHGLLGLSGIALLTVGLINVDASIGWWILVSFVIVAAGGFYLFSRQIKDEPWPAAVIIAHGGLALVTIVGLGLWIAGGITTMDDGSGDTPADSIENEPIPVEELVQ